MESTEWSKSSESESSSRPSLERIFATAESNLRDGLSTLSAWSDQARDVLESRPGVVLASLSIAGFMAGLMARGGGSLFERAGRKGFMADPLVVFLTGAFAGFTVGPRLLREAGKDFNGMPEGARGEEGKPSDVEPRRNNVSEFERIADRFNH